MTIFLTGASGLVGAAFARAAARRGHRVTGIVGTFAGAIEGLAAQRSVDLTRESDVTAALLDVFPQAIVNCAAVSVPEQCDADPALAQALNVALPALLARLAHHVGARLVHLSSEQVFDGARPTPYAPGDPVTPINLYGRQKVESERAVHAAAAEWAVTLRAPLLMGNSLAGRRSNHERLFADWAAGRTPRLFVDEFRQTCTAENLAEVMVELCERRDPAGVFHWAGAELLSRHALGLRIREHFKLTPAQAPIAEATRAAAPEIARKRQACLALDLSPLAGKLKTRPQTLAEQLEELKVPPPCREWYLGL
ncbi:MAG: sugar nucleotide-binding protein [Opitutaceae bacterium]|nr:sugar nucleotide-binding protein [Opitutaceae bacterium]